MSWPWKLCASSWRSNGSHRGHRHWCKRARDHDGACSCACGQKRKVHA